MDTIEDHRTNGKQLSLEESYITSPNGGRRRRETTKGWEILICWKDGSTTWETMKDVKNTYSLQLAEYAHQQQLTFKPAFIW